MLFDCLGAGQRVVQELFPGRSWREEPDLLPEMWQALTALRAVHEQILLLQAAARLPLAADERARLETLLAEMAPEGGWTADSLAMSGAAPHDRVADFIRSLRRHFAA